MKFSGGLVHQARGDVHWPIVRWLSAGSVPAALVGLVVTFHRKNSRRGAKATTS